MFNEKTAKVNTYYWIQKKHTDKIIPLLFNIDREWRVELNSETEFLSPGKLRLIYGKDCVLREVDFENDKVDSIPEEFYQIKLAPFALLKEESIDISANIIFRNDFIVSMGGVYMPANNFESKGFYLKYKKKD